ncbi:Eclosion hormone [Frankliniella occidentalis]|uniref:Eclosion hormone n=1 Tax=Frankliniella occidentalis TaxID=133901 RepID=A0A6J1S097_FRAOC|nr:eclosion hormone [Frankliniella occidentalis]KAE8741976.1 Eclosion hormone [Frankliniella occidentalis]
MPLSAKMVSLMLLLLVLSASLAASNQVHICVENCAQCKRMLGDYFHGQLCAETCVELGGASIPDCQDVDSIRPFLVKADLV